MNKKFSKRKTIPCKSAWDGDLSIVAISGSRGGSGDGDDGGDGNDVDDPVQL